YILSFCPHTTPLSPETPRWFSGTARLESYGPSAAGLNRFANRRTPSRIGTARSRSITIDVISINVQCILAAGPVRSDCCSFLDRGCADARITNFCLSLVANSAYLQASALFLQCFARPASSPGRNLIYKRTRWRVLCAWGVNAT